MIERLIPFTLIIGFCLFGIANGVIAQSNNPQENKEIAMRAIDWWLSGADIDPTTLFASDYISHLDSATNPNQGRQKHSLKEVEAEIEKFHAAFKNVKILNTIQVAEDNLVATHVVIQANHVGSFMGEPPTKKTVTYDAVEFVKIEDGKIIETWVTWDKYGFLKQMGALK
ncbi:ester cyclase [Microbulbifer variabilis]|uniref:ester cyclase n=1 Tax=Microbulbifer variabilis TaxID=266805 RepID=UPI001CFD7DB7|nr:ester cyclase [Microbulbifer variabilis]